MLGVRFECDSDSLYLWSERDLVSSQDVFMDASIVVVKRIGGDLVGYMHVEESSSEPGKCMCIVVTNQKNERVGLYATREYSSVTITSFDGISANCVKLLSELL